MSETCKYCGLGESERLGAPLYVKAGGWGHRSCWIYWVDMALEKDDPTQPTLSTTVAAPITVADIMAMESAWDEYSGGGRVLADEYYRRRREFMADWLNRRMGA